jgi:hypothetical protein
LNKRIPDISSISHKKSADLNTSIDRLAGFPKRIGRIGVELVDSIDELLEK